jgi:hypothetical protein
VYNLKEPSALALPDSPVSRLTLIPCEKQEDFVSTPSQAVLRQSAMYYIDIVVSQVAVVNAELTGT